MPSDPRSEAELLAGLRARRTESFELLVSAYGPRLLATASRIVGPGGAEDAVREALLKAWRFIGDFEGSSSLYTWLHRIVVNEALARLRTAKRREDSLAVETPVFATASAELPEPGLPLEKQVAMHRVVQKALGQIPEDLRIVLLLRDVEELSSKEVAAQLGVSDALVRQRLHRARTAMAELLRPELCDGPALTCGGRLDLLMDYIDACLPDDLQEPVSQHLAACPVCGQMLRTYRETISSAKAILEPALDAPLPAGFMNRAVERLRSA